MAGANTIWLTIDEDLALLGIGILLGWRVFTMGDARLGAFGGSLPGVVASAAALLARLSAVD